MKTIVQAFLDLANYVENANLEDPDKAQGAAEVVGWCLAEMSDEERALLGQVALQIAADLRTRGIQLGDVDYYESFAKRISTSPDRPVTGKFDDEVNLC